MTDEQCDRLAASVSAHLAAHPPEGIVLRLVSFERTEEGLRAHFATNAPMSPSDTRVPDAVNEALREALRGEAPGLRVEVRVDVEV